MPEAVLPEPPLQVPSTNTNADFHAFQNYSWDLDKDFLGGLVLALGGHRSLSQTASQADIIMHSRIFYYARIRGVTISYGPYRAWLRAQLSQQQQPPPRIWEWHLLQAMCNHRDRIAGAPPADQAQQAIAAAEQNAWLRRLLGDGAAPVDAGASDNDPKPAWMAAAPQAELYVDRDADGADGTGEQVPYPERFAAIIKAVQTGEPVEGIMEVPDILARNATTTPFGRLERPRKPWEKVEPAFDTTADGERPGWGGSVLDESFPAQDNDPAGANDSFTKSADA